MYLPWGKVPETTCQELWQKREIVQIVDVRSAQEFKHSHIEGAVNLPITQLNESTIQSLGLDPDQPVVTICYRHTGVFLQHADWPRWVIQSHS